MKCPNCNIGQTRVVSTQKGDFLDSRFSSRSHMEALVAKYTPVSVFRLRECRKCRIRLMTVETVLLDMGPLEEGPSSPPEP